MKIMSRVFLVVALAGLMVPDVGLANSDVTFRPLSDFLDAQGTTSLFFPPVPDYLAWTDAEFVDIGVIDYAGLAAEWLESQGGPELGTTTSGYVKEREIDDGRAEIKVVLHTENALAFAQDIAELLDNDLDFANTPTTFGVKAMDVLDGADPSTGWAHLNLTFVMPEPGAALPDLRIMLQESVAEHQPISLGFTSQAFGTTEDGTPAHLFVHQTASTDDEGNLVFDEERVEILELGGDEP